MVLLRTSANSGHGLGTALSDQIEEQVDVFAFLFDRLGVKVTPCAIRSASLSDDDRTRLAGLEPATLGSEDRCSIH